MSDPSDYIDDVSRLATELEKAGFTPVLIGGMALVIMGSRRITRDFDFLISGHDTDRETLLGIFYRRGFELASRINSQGDIVRTIDNAQVAAIRLKMDAPSSLHFLNPRTGLRVDLLLDYPVPAREIASRATRKKIRSHFLRVASRQDLLRLKEIACASRSLAADAQDLEFLRKLRRKVGA